ncbi:MAG TPA: chemotaxis protein CheB [Puia sp.]|jgi:two-component system chemotaxis response regulator CheB
MTPDKQHPLTGIPPGSRLLVIGGSAGSLHVILGILTVLRAGFPLPVLVVLHRNGVFESSLEDLFASRTDLPIKEVEEKEPVLPGIVYLCPADYHVLLEKDHTFSLDYSERIHFSRPSIDVSFRSAADAYGPGLICLLLSGGNVDGTEGLQYAQERGGVIVVQDPQTADVPYMPQQAVSRMKVDFVVPSEDLPDFIKSLTGLR